MCVVMGLHLPITVIPVSGQNVVLQACLLIVWHSASGAYGRIREEKVELQDSVLG